MKASNLRATTSRVPNILTKREKQAIDFITACGYDVNAFSISFDITRTRVKALLYYNRAEMHMLPKELAADKENGCGTAPTHTPPMPAPSAQVSIHARTHEQPKKQAQKQAGGLKPSKPKVNRNALSACGSSNLLSEAAIAAQARADATKEPKPKRARVAAAHESPSPDDASVEEMKHLKDAAARVNFPVPTTPEQAEVFLQAVLGIKLYRSDGLSEGETKGEIVGYNCINGTNYGGMDEPLPQGARAAFLIAESEWQEVPSSKGKRGRGS